MKLTITTLYDDKHSTRQIQITKGTITQEDRQKIADDYDAVLCYNGLEFEEDERYIDFEETEINEDNTGSDQWIEIM